MHALNELRDQIIPATVGQVAGRHASTSAATRPARRTSPVSSTSRLPLIFAFVFGLAFLLMLVTFRSIVIPIKAIILNLLSVGAAYGVLVLVFQNGHGESLLGFTSNGGVTNWLPLFLFVVLFGLSMDYHVFILSRVRELYDRGMSTDEAVKQGISTTAGTVTSAAAVMVGVFAVFVTLSFLDFKEMGLGLAVAVLIDATIIRGVLLPASMKLLGDWNWYLPRWLEWLPRIGAERDAGPPIEPEDPQAPDEPEPADAPRARAGAGLRARDHGRVPGNRSSVAFQRSRSQGRDALPPVSDEPPGALRPEGRRRACRTLSSPRCRRRRERPRRPQDAAGGRRRRPCRRRAERACARRGITPRRPAARSGPRFDPRPRASAPAGAARRAARSEHALPRERSCTCKARSSAAGPASPASAAWRRPNRCAPAIASAPAAS